MELLSDHKLIILLFSQWRVRKSLDLKPLNSITATFDQIQTFNIL